MSFQSGNITLVNATLEEAIPNLMGKKNDFDQSAKDELVHSI